ncbi:YopX family protein [Streptococcus suis]|uniref:YopX family protein n=1 Tax=Streptococcus suis TaxID=1307 RepID=UPI00240E243B|nr:YopX family protein [Streptococcus suis]WFA76646.1 YopX family protein [Streptococcus suis]
MIPKFRAYNPATNAWYKPEEVFVSDGKIYLDDDDFDGLLQNNDVDLMQSTGLFDRNDHEVYLGDIVRCTSGCPHEVVFLEAYGGTLLGGMPAIYLSGIKEGYAWTGDEIIIGNIYENPKLMEGLDEN